MIPTPRTPLADPGLWRPDWLQNTPRDPGLLWLDKNENRDPQQLALVSRVMASLDPESFSTYPDSAALYRKLAGWVGVDPHCLLLTPGSDGAIRLCFETFVAEGDAVVITEPTFAMYPVYSKMFGAKVTALQYRASNEGPILPAADIVSAIARVKPKMACLPNPDSPTGTTFGEKDLRAIIEAAGAAGAAMLIDEAYYPFCAETVVPWIREYPHLIVARTLAKAWGMAGLRIGYAVASPEVATLLHKMRPMYECSTVAMAAMDAMLDHVAETDASVARLEAGKAYFLQAMTGLGFHVLNGKGNFLHVAFGPQAGLVHEALKDICYYRKDFNEPCLKGFSRFSSTTVEQFKPVVEAIQAAVKWSVNV
jgi:histidinol-phosphate aminotransferase